jgi:hypothetical protein
METKDDNMTEITESAKTKFQSSKFNTVHEQPIVTFHPLPLKRPKKGNTWEEALSCFAVVFNESFPLLSCQLGQERSARRHIGKTEKR